MTKNSTWTRGLVAATLLAGFGSAHAQLTVDGDKTGVTYAKETFLLANTTSATGKATKYYNIARSHAIAGAAQVRKTALHDAERYTISYELTGMVFVDAPSLARSDGPNADTNGTESSFSVFAGGAKGDGYVVFQAGTQSGTIEPTDILTLTAFLAVSTDGGGIKRTVSNTNLQNTPGVPISSWQREYELPNAVTVQSALKETVDPKDAIAGADHDFMAFGTTIAKPNLTTSLGSVMLGVVSPNLRNAQSLGPDPNNPNSGLDANGDKLAVTALSDIIATKSNPTINPVTFSGDVSFVSKVALIASDTCSGLATTTTDLRVPSKDDPKVLTDTLKKTDANDFTTAQHLCLMVDGKTVIPTGSYSVQTEYAPKDTTHAFAAPGSTHSLGSITHDGTMVHIPYLSTYEGYAQRLVLRNRANRGVTYTLTFAPEAGMTVTPSTLSGTVDARTVQMIRVDQLVEITGGSRTSATLVSNAAATTFGVATVLVNREDGSTDTETHAP